MGSFPGNQKCFHKPDKVQNSVADERFVLGNNRLMMMLSESMKPLSLFHCTFEEQNEGKLSK